MLALEDHEKIRLAVFRDGMSRREAARLFKHGRNTIRKILASGDGPRYTRSAAVKTSLDPFTAILDAWLEDEIARNVPRKQRSNALVLQKRLADEHGYSGSVYPVRRYLRQKRRRSGNEVYFPLVFTPGEEAQVDWGEAWVTMAGAPVKVQLFCMRACYSRATFVRAYRSQKTECFLDGHVRAFRHFEGVPRRVAYDNLSTAVIRVGKGRERTLTPAFRALRAHYVFESRFCNVASGNEKGRVENLVKLAQSDFLAGCPSFADWNALNAHLEACCLRDLSRRAPDSSKTRAELWASEHPYWLELKNGDAEACVKKSTFAGARSLVQFDTHYYSVPTRHAHTVLTVKGFADHVEVWNRDECVCRHPRCWDDAGRYVLDYRHYLTLLERKPGGLANGRPFMGEPWGEDLERFRVELAFRNPDDGEGRFVDLLLLLAQHPEEAVFAAVRECARRRAWSVEAVRSTLTFSEPARPAALDMSRWPELSLEGDGIRPASEYDAALLSPDGDDDPPEPPPAAGVADPDEGRASA